MDTVIIDDDHGNDCHTEFKHQENKKKYYSHFKADQFTSNQTQLVNPPHPGNVEDVAMFIKVIKFGTDMNRNRTNYMEVMDVIEENGKDLLIAKRLKLYTDPILEVVPLSTSFDLIAEAHLALNHSKGEQFCSTLSKIYSMPQVWIEVFLKVCNVCSKDSSNSRTTENNRNNKFEEDKGVDKTDKSTLKKNPLIELDISKILKKSAHIVECSVIRMLENNEFQFVLCYIDLTTFYVILKPLKTTHTPELTLELLKIFADFKVPEYYICDKSSVWLEQFNDIFATRAANMFNVKFPTLVRGKNPLESEVRILINKIQSMLIDLKDWPVAIKHIQWQLNVTDEKYKPYYNHFGCFVEDTSKCESEEKFTNVICEACGKIVYKKYKCCYCKKLVHITCCVVKLLRGRLNQISYICKSCQKCNKKVIKRK